MGQPAKGLGLALNPAGKASAVRDGTSLFKNFTAAGSGKVKQGAGLFQGLVVGEGAAGSTFEVFDGVDNTGTPIGIFNTANPMNWTGFEINFTVGLFVVMAGGNANVTILYV